MKVIRRLVVSAATAVSLGSLGGATVTFTGGEDGLGTDWAVDSNWSSGAVPSSEDDVVIDGKTVTARGSLDIKSLSVLNGARLTVSALGLLDAELSVFETLETDLAPIAAKLWERATIVNVRENLMVEGADSTVFPDADKVSGVPVVFKVGGDFSLGEGASFNAVERGWGWVVDAAPTSAAKKNTGNIPSAWSFAPGSGRDYTIGGGYGGQSPRAETRSDVQYGYAYGFACAPFLPGSNSGLYSQKTPADQEKTRGGGVVVVYTAGQATIDGCIDVSSTYHDHSAASGGGIWLMAQKFAFGANALLDAHGGYTLAYEGGGVGGGGRIALAEGYSWADVATAATGVVPEGFVDAGIIYDFEVATDVAGGAYAGTNKKYDPYPGTLSYVRMTTAPVKIVVTIDGAGTVTHGGTTYSESFALTVPAAETLSLSAAGADGSAFMLWLSDLPFPGEDETSATLEFVPTVPMRFRAVFASAVPTARTWTGGVSADWYVGANWNPAGVPGPNDDVTLSGSSLSLQRSVSVRSLTLTAAADLTVGDKTERGVATLMTGGDLTVEGGSKLTVYAGTLADHSVFAQSDFALLAAALWQSAKIVSVGGNLTVRDVGSTVSPDADKVTGVPVVFKVGGDFSLGEGASFNAVERGWGWISDRAALPGAKMNTGKISSAWSFAPGSGRDYMIGGGYGGQSPRAGVWNGSRYGFAYGFACAPFLPGSNGGLYVLDKPEAQETTRGGGAVVVYAAGRATIDGCIDVSSTYHDYSGASGGGIWLMARKFAFGANALLDAHGGYTKSYQGGGVGGGGRIALAEGYSWADVETAATGVVPENFTDAGTIPATEVKADVAGGDYMGTGKSYDAYPGTLSFVRSSSLPVNLRVVIEGDGAVTYDGKTYTSTFDVTVPVRQELTLTATAGEGSQFVSWGGSAIEGGVCEDPEVSLTLDVPAEIVVSFSLGTIVRTWIGGKAGDWSAPLNWSPIGVPRSTDDVVIEGGLVLSRGDLAVGALTLAGSAVLSNAAVAVEGDSSLANLAGGATVIRVAGALRLEDSAALIPANEPKSGAPVRYEVGSLYVGEGARIDASGQGWSWYESADDPYATLTQGDYKTRAPGAGGDDSSEGAYNRGGAYGALGGNAKIPYGQPYGSAYAPLLPGSPNGLYRFLLTNMHRPGGTVWVKCRGLMELYGTIASNGQSSFYGSPSGGGVWLCAKGVKSSPTAVVTANGGYLENGSYPSMASGGRIALAVGATDAQLAALVDGEDPETLGLTVQEGVSLFEATARGSLKAGATPVYGNDGTVVTMIGSEGYVNVSVSGSPVAALGTDPASGIQAYEKGVVQTFGAPLYGVDPNNPAVRYACTGYVVTATDGEVARGEANVVSFAIEKPVSVVWQWGAAEKRALVHKPEHGTLTVGGVAVDGDAVSWSAGRMDPVEAIPDEGYEFVCWEGVLPLGCAMQNPLVADLTRPLDATPVFRRSEDPTTRTWNGTGDWKDVTKWTPAGNVPGTGDTVVIAGGTCTVPNALAAAALRVTGGVLDVGCATAEGNAEIVVTGDVEISGGTVNLGAGARYVPTSDSSGRVEPAILWKGNGRLFVGGDLTLGGTATLAVMGGAVGGDYTFATGGSFVEVGKALTLADRSVLALYSEFMTGGSVKVTAGTVTVAEGAKVDACGKGYMWLDSKTPPNAPGIGYDYYVGGSHGGVGASKDGIGLPAYDFPVSPVQPGSPNGSYSDGQKPGGGLIRIHAQTMNIAGTLDASAFAENAFGGAAGGGIWLTAKDFAFGPNAVLTARGGRSSQIYASYGAGGRIAINRNVDDEQLASLAETGTWRGFRSRRLKTAEEFRELLGNATMTVDVRWGGDTPAGLETALAEAQDVLAAAKAEAARTDLTPEEKKAADQAVTNANATVAALKTCIQCEPLANGTFVFVDGTVFGALLILL